MAKRDLTKEKLAILGQIEQGPLTPESQKTLGKTLSLANNILVAKAATIVGQRRVEALTPDLLKAFGRFCENPLKRDKGCLAKEAIIEALDEMEFDDADIFVKGIRWVQAEPAYGRPVDTAAGMRGRCAFALARLGGPDTVYELVDLLVDPEPQPRIAAVRALVGIPGEQSEPLLRLKATIGDDSHRVIAECLSALVRINAGRSIDFVARFLNSSDMIIAENAAFALGESRLEEAFTILRRHREASPNPEWQELLLMPIAITRSEEAFDYLVEVIETETPGSVASARKAIRIFDDESHRQRIPSTTGAP
ncbi:hypothetical protein DSCO28_55120 [Desulfosarcina ovata subsp. sediminis]|uniref:HEAT repeat domain-containing protein n=1 Tax=Desulfosarcina ovata subsp. sediminis TaxID=885957 RepID=A0A5K7ZXR7_9BACT|nr:HEAT repeat domain-containing protein [Desulfosarcina ovata]BBO84946.1 hypothetical protein DSCO28_55120 [Desulfosarcina ovata subsp. sediminis]